jgi:hypothetical protein
MVEYALSDGAMKATPNQRSREGRAMRKLTLKGARAKLARIQSDVEDVAEYLNGACCEKEEQELCGVLEPVGNIDFMLEQLQ